MNGGNISDGQKEASGKGTGLTVKSAPPEVNEKVPPKTTTEKQLEKLQFEFDELQLRWLQDTKKLEHQMGYVREEAERAINGMRAQYEKNVEELMRARAKFDKYLVRNQELEDEVAELKTKIAKFIDGENG